VNNRLKEAVIAAGIVGLACAPVVHAKEIVEQVSAAGTFLTSRIDANGDNEASSWCTLQITGKASSESMQQCINEDVFAGFTAECPGGVFVIDAANGVGAGAGVRTFRNGDQLFLALTNRYLCADDQGHVTNGEDGGVILGGTGDYEGATGTFQYTYTGQILYGDPFAVPAQFFGAVSSVSGTWVIDVPDSTDEQ